jgi:phosphatidylglycerol:prolipoprotein diacylglycerol transferase
MQQVLFRIPPETGLPVYGFGIMLLIAISTAAWLAGRRAEAEGIAQRDSLYDFLMWVVLGGLIGARLFFVIQFPQGGNPILNFIKIWDGGIVFYGSAIGGLIAGIIARRRFLSKFNISIFKLADVVAPSIAIGLCLGRIGCFLNGCCWGHVACPECRPAAHFPLMTTPAREMVRDFQTSAGFAMDPLATDECAVGAVEPDSAANAAGLERGDVIVAVNGKPVADYRDLVTVLAYDWPRGKTDVTLTIRRGTEEMVLPPYIPRTLGLVPTQIYESISMFLVFLVLLALYPLRKYDGQVMVALMLCYGVHRFFNETLRNDTPTYFLDLFGAHIPLGLTISQWISILIVAAGVALHLWRRRYAIQSGTGSAAKQPITQPA